MCRPLCQSLYGEMDDWVNKQIHLNCILLRESFCNNQKLKSPLLIQWEKQVVLGWECAGGQMLDWQVPLVSPDSWSILNEISFHVQCPELLPRALISHFSCSCCLIVFQMPAEGPGISLPRAWVTWGRARDTGNGPRSCPGLGEGPLLLTFTLCSCQSRGLTFGDSNPDSSRIGLWPWRASAELHEHLLSP